MVLVVTLAVRVDRRVDDYKKLCCANSKGAAARWKYFWHLRSRCRGRLTVPTAIAGETQLLSRSSRMCSRPRKVYVLLTYFDIDAPAMR